MEASLWPCEYQPQMTLKTWVAASVASWEIPDQNGGFFRWENPGKIIKLIGTKWWIFRCHVELPEGSSFVSTFEDFFGLSSIEHPYFSASSKSRWTSPGIPL
jgi:hypothetical protein